MLVRPRPFLPLALGLVLLAPWAVPFAGAATVQPGTIVLSSTVLHPGDTLWVSSGVNASGNLTALSFVFSNATNASVRVDANLTDLGNGSYRVQRTIPSSEPLGRYTLDRVEWCDAGGCGNDTTDLTTPNGTVASYDVFSSALPDLVADGVTAPWNATEGDVVFVSGSYSNGGSASASNFTVALFVDGMAVAWRPNASLAPHSSGGIGAAWNGSTGWHSLELIVDLGDRVLESDETNNKILSWFYVAPVPVTDVGVHIAGVTHEPLATDAGNLPDPLARHVIHLDVRNRGPTNASAYVWLDAEAQTRFVPLATSKNIGVLSLFLTAGETRRVDVAWEPEVALGDVTIHAHIEPARAVDSDRSDNDDSAHDFVIVGGLGGILAQP